MKSASRCVGDATIWRSSEGMRWSTTRHHPARTTRRSRAWPPRGRSSSRPARRRHRLRPWAHLRERRRGGDPMGRRLTRIPVARRRACQLGLRDRGRLDPGGPPGEAHPAPGGFPPLPGRPRMTPHAGCRAPASSRLGVIPDTVLTRTDDVSSCLPVITRGSRRSPSTDGAPNADCPARILAESRVIRALDAPVQAGRHGVTTGEPAGRGRQQTCSVNRA